MLLNEALFEELDDKVEIEYSDLEIERDHGSPGGYFDSSFGNWLPVEDWRTHYVDWTYKVDTWDVIDVLADIVKKKYGVKNFVINCLDPVIVSHSGPGTLAIFYLGKER